MTFHILMDHVTTLFVSLGLLTTLSFDSEITSYLYGGSKEDFFIKVTNNHKTLAIKPTRKGISSNLLVITKFRKYYFDLRYNKDKPHQFIEVKQGQINHGMKKVMSKKSFDLLEGSSSVLVINKKKRKLRVNKKKVKKKDYFSKGVPIFIEGKRVLN
jgi:hypothetical protein